MALPEGVTTEYSHCGREAKLEVIFTRSHCIGFFCSRCKRYFRVSDYYPTSKDALIALRSGEFTHKVH
jgi:hypothetical protein